MEKRRVVMKPKLSFSPPIQGQLLLLMIEIILKKSKLFELIYIDISK